MPSSQPEPFAQWAIVELMGHQRVAGWVTEQTVGGASLLRVDVYRPDDEKPWFTRFYGPSAVYSICPVARQIALALVSRVVVAPVSPYDLTNLSQDKQLGWNEPEGDLDDE